MADRKRAIAIFARLTAALTRGNLFAIDIEGEKLGHKVLERLAERSEVKAFLDATLLAAMSDPVAQKQGSRWVLSLPSAKLTPAD